MERRMRGAVQRCWREIQRSCAKKDPKREGHISTMSFLGEQQTTYIIIYDTELYLPAEVHAEVHDKDWLCVTEIIQALHIDMTREQFEYLAEKSGIMNNGCVSYHDFLCHFLLNLNPAEAKRAFERQELPLPPTPVNKEGGKTIVCNSVAAWHKLLWEIHLICLNRHICWATVAGMLIFLHIQYVCKSCP